MFVVLIFQLFLIKPAISDGCIAACRCNATEVFCEDLSHEEAVHIKHPNPRDVRKLTISNAPNYARLDRKLLAQFPNLQTLKIHHTELNKIDPKLLRRSKLEILDLQHNAIKILPWQPMSHHSNPLKKLLLNGNPLACGQCRNAWIFNSNTTVSQKFTDIITVLQSDNTTKPRQIDCLKLGGCPQSLTTSGVFSLPQVFHDDAVCERTLDFSECDDQLELSVPQIDFIDKRYPYRVAPDSAIEVTCRRSSAGTAQIMMIGYYRMSDAEDSEERPWEIFSLGKGNFDQKFVVSHKASSLDSGWALCGLAGQGSPHIASIPVVVQDKPIILASRFMHDLNHSSTYSPSYKLQIPFTIVGIPLASVEIVSLQSQSVLPRVVVAQIEDLSNFYATKGEIVLEPRGSSWRSLCLGNYSLVGCNSLGCDQVEFEIKGSPPGFCNRDATLMQVVSKDAPEHHRRSSGIITRNLIIAIGTAFCGLTMIVLFIKQRRRKRITKAVGDMPAKTVELNSAMYEALQLATENQLYFSWLESIAQKSEIAVFQERAISIQRQLGEGAFGYVYLVDVSTEVLTGADGCNESEGGVEKKVPELMAMKVIKPTLMQDRLGDLEQEARMLSTLDHPNIVKFYGLSLVNDRTALLFEFMENGDLVNYLRNHKCSSNYKNLFPLKELTSISIQIASGMVYLHARRLVHRDLAARNCLVGPKLEIKISDFGMTRDVYVTDYYKMDAKTLVPIRWLPPESILYRKFTTESDVWSFGVVLWEIYSGGRVPYCELSNYEVLECILANKILSCPVECPQSIYNVMAECWKEEPGQRNKMIQLKEKLETISATSAYGFSIKL